MCTSSSAASFPCGLHAVELTTQFAAPLALGAPRLLEPLEQLRLIRPLRLDATELTLEPLALLHSRGARVRGPAFRIRAAALPAAAPQ